MNNQIHEPRKGTTYRKARLRRVMAAAALILCSLVFCAPVPRCWGQETAVSGQETVAIEVEYGYDNMAKGGRYLPVTVTMTNRQDEAVEGVLQIKSMESDGTIYRYDYDVALEGAGRQKLEEYIPLGTSASQLFFEIEGADGAVLGSREVKLNVSWDVPELFIGILSDNPEELKYLNGVGISYGTLRTRTFSLDEARFPSEEIGLNLLDVLVVNSYKLRNLSEEQTGAIMDWVHSGGVLILGTGERVDDTLGRFAPELLDDSYDSPGLRHIDLGEEFPMDNPEDGMLAVSCVDIPLHGGNVIISSSGFALLTAVAKQQGLIGVAAFDLADIARFCEQQSAYVDYLFTSLLGESRINRLAEVVYSGNSGRFWSVQSLINTGNVEKLPRISLYTGIVVIYLLCLGPGIYLFLRNRGLQAYYRRGIAALSVIFTVIIYLMGSTTRFKSTFFTYATIQDVTEDYITDTTYVNIRNPYNRPYTVEFDPSYSVLPITRSSMRGRIADGFTGDEPYQIAIQRKDDRLTIQGQNIVAFAPRYFQLEKKSLNVDGTGIIGDVDYFEGKLSGTVTNQFPFPLENAALILYGNMVYLGRMEAGETRSLDDLELLRFPLNNTYAVAEWITGQGGYQRTDIDDTGYLLAMKRASMLMFYLDNYMSGYTADARVIAFRTEKEERQFLAGQTQETYGLTMLTSAVAVNASRNRSLYRSVLMKTPVVVNGSYDAQSNSMGAMEPLTLEYQMGTDIKVESLTFESISRAFLGEDGDDYIDAFQGGIYFYNHGSGSFDRMDLEGKTMEVEELRPYLSPGNILTVRYVYEGAGSYNAIQLPMPMVAGREQ